MADQRRYQKLDPAGVAAIPPAAAEAPAPPPPPSGRRPCCQAAVDSDGVQHDHSGTPPAERIRYRTDNSTGRTVYQTAPDGREWCVGLLDSPEIAQELVDAVNGRRAAMEGHCGWYMTNAEKIRIEEQAYERGRLAGRREAARDAVFVALVPNGPGDFWLGTFTDQAAATAAASKVRRPGATVHVIESAPGQGMVPVIIRGVGGELDGT